MILQIPFSFPWSRENGWKIVSGEMTDERIVKKDITRNSLPVWSVVSYPHGLAMCHMGRGFMCQTCGASATVFHPLMLLCITKSNNTASSDLNHVTKAFDTRNTTLAIFLGSFFLCRLLLIHDIFVSWGRRGKNFFISYCIPSFSDLTMSQSCQDSSREQGKRIGVCEICVMIQRLQTSRPSLPDIKYQVILNILVAWCFISDTSIWNSGILNSSYKLLMWTH